jgi:hypothetical protein
MTGDKKAKKKEGKNLLSVGWVEQYAAMDYDELHPELMKMWRQYRRLEDWFIRDRQRLFAAMLVMRNLTTKPGRRVAIDGDPNWEEECRLLGKSPSLIRMWMFRTRTATDRDMLALLGEQKGEPKQRVTESRRDQYLRRLVDLNISGNTVDAKELARRIREEFPTL